MLLEDLPKSYRQLARKRKKEYEAITGTHYNPDKEVDEPENRINWMFDWASSPEGHTFWNKIHGTSSTSLLPAISEDSLEEIEPTNPNLEV